MNSLRNAKRAFGKSDFSKFYFFAVAGIMTPIRVHCPVEVEIDSSIAQRPDCCTKLEYSINLPVHMKITYIGNNLEYRLVAEHSCFCLF